ncbi:MAG: hypothetical protein GC154_02750 [bacterium]|nr:hypothetical protein [bacterium]
MKKLIVPIIFGLFCLNLQAQVNFDPWDPGDDNLIGATELAIPSSDVIEHGPHTLSSGDNEDWFVFTLLGGVSYEFSTTGTIQLTGELLALDGKTIVVSALDANQAGQIRIQYTPSESSQFYLHISKTIQSDSGTYRARFRGVDGSTPGDEWDPADDNAAGATDLGALTSSPRTHGPHLLDANDHEDWFRFTVKAGEAFLLSSIGNANVKGELYRSTGLVKLTGNDDANGVNFEIRYQPPSDGELWLRVTLSGDEVFGEYTISYYSGVEPPAPGDEWDPQDDTVNSATNLGEPGDAEMTHGPHTLSASDRDDYFLLKLTGGYEYEFTTSGDSNTVGEILLDDGVTQTSEDVDSGDGLNFNILYSVAETGTYYLHVREFAGEDASYTLHYRRTQKLPEPASDEWDPGDDSPAGAVALSDPAANEQTHGPHTLSSVDFEDCFSIQLKQGVQYEFWTSGLADTIGTLAYHVDPTFVLSEEDGGGTQSNFRIVYTPVSDGRFVLRIKQYDPGAAGEYTLHYRLVETPSEEGDGWDPADNSPETSTPLTLASPNGGVHGPHRIGGGDGVDWFQIVLEKGVYYEFYSTGEADTEAALYLPNGEYQLASDQDGGAGANFDLAYTPVETGVYLLRVREELGASGVYDLRYFSSLQAAAPTGVSPNMVYKLNDASEFTAIGGGFSGAFPSGEAIIGDIEQSPLLYGDGRGAVITTGPNAVMLLQFPEVDAGSGRLLLRASIKANSPGAQVWLAAMDVSLDGSAASTMYANSAVLQDGYQRVCMIYNPPSGAAAPIVQIVNSSGAEPAQVVIDTLEVYILPAEGAWPAELFFPNTNAPAGSGPRFAIRKAFSLNDAVQYTEVPGGFTINPDTGEKLYGAGITEQGPILYNESRPSDGLGVSIMAGPGEVQLLTLPTVQTGAATALIRAKIRTSDAGSAPALAALDASLNGTIAADIPANSGIFSPADGTLSVILNAPSGAVVPVVQLANLTGGGNVILYVDEVEVYLLPNSGGVPASVAGGMSTR